MWMKAKPKIMVMGSFQEKVKGEAWWGVGGL